MSDLSERAVEMLAKNLPRFDWETLLTFKSEDGDGGALTDEERKALADYFSAFLPPSLERREHETLLLCACCGTRLNGFAALLCGTGFTWGIANGEGHCGKCGYPARALHRNVGPIEFFEFVLQYHPSGLRIPSKITESTPRPPAPTNMEIL